VFPHPKLRESFADKVIIDEGAMEVLTAHAQAKKARAQ
jgi:hypothetical protein